MKTKIKTLLGILALGCVSCNNFLDVEQKGMVIPQTVEDYDNILNNTNGRINNTLYMSPEVEVSEEQMPIISVSAGFKGYRWDDYQYLAGENSDNDWNQMYRRIAACNEIIEHIGNAGSTTLNELLRKSVKGQAYADRAKCYFALINTYALPYSAENRNKPGVPLVLKDDILQKSSRATIGEVYDQICEDLNIARNLVPVSVDSRQNIKACYQGVMAFKAKVHLFRNEIDSACNAIEKAFETVPELEYVNENNLPGQKLLAHENKEIIWLGKVLDNSRSAQLYYSKSLLDLYDQENDNRFIFHAITSDQYGATYSIPRYISNTARTFAVSAPEMYLLRAECLARKGDYQEAINNLNTLRESRYKEGADYELSATNKEDAITKVKEERLRELAFTGQYWFDLRRYQAYGESVPTFTRLIDGKTYTLEPGSNRYVCSIARYIIGKNPNIEQNPR